MKKFSKYLLITFSIALASASCTVQKRLHNPGYHVQFNSPNKNKVDQSSKVAEQIALEESKNEQVRVVETKPEHNIASVNTTQNEIIVEYAENTDLASTDETVSFETAAAAKKKTFQDKYTTFSQRENVSTTIAKENTKTSNASSSAVPAGLAILLIILCFFPLLNLIPVYITDSGVTLNFWVTLILNLTYIGAVIFSLLVLLGIVSLA